jgi:hypothetical protein
MAREADLSVAASASVAPAAASAEVSGSGGSSGSVPYGGLSIKAATEPLVSLNALVRLETGAANVNIN